MATTVYHPQQVPPSFKYFPNFDAANAAPVSERVLYVYPTVPPAPAVFNVTFSIADQSNTSLLGATVVFDGNTL